MSPPRRRSSKDKYKRRSRSRSRDRRRYEDRRSRSRSRDRARRHRSRSPRYRSRSPTNRSYDIRRSRDRSKDKKSSKNASSYPPPMQRTENLADLSMEEKEMMKMMGFCSFDTTKGKKVEGNDVGAVHVILKRKYRQYMNRKGGFNRPLDFVA